MTLCDDCVTIRDSTVPRLFPTHLVHPHDHTPQLWDVRCEAICPTCKTLWHYNRRAKAAEIVG
jgi:hypothetical protein